MASVAQIIRSSVAVACTGCDYCKSACPMQIPISQCFSMYNEYLLYPRHQWKIVPAYNLLPVKASACIGCESCQDHCPQKLPIAEHMRQVKDVLEV
jgi:predicted aldo/keto reductase-like oxidoreductase